MAAAAQDVHSLLEELEAEHKALDAVVEPLDDAAWDVLTPASPWLVRDQIGHLAFFDDRGRLAAADPAAFTVERDAALADFPAFEELAGRLARDSTGVALLVAWRTARASCLDALHALDEGVRLPWYGPPMSVRSFATARLMETWAHGQDVVDGLASAGHRVDRSPTDRLRHICHLGFSTRGWSYTVRGREVPASPVRVELLLPTGARWMAGDAAAVDVVRGSAQDFCLVVTQRRGVAETALELEGDAAAEWLSIAQCFAGAPTLPPSRGPTSR
ncbi:MAG: TIGR03084 family metal-binding protein [Acidimicrobiales bacterium]